MGASKRAFHARLPPILTLSTRYKTGWNVTKCHACHLKRHDNLLGNLRQGEVLQLPLKTRRGHRKTRDSRRDMWEHQNRAFYARLPPILTPSTRYKTGWNVTKCHACHAKRHDNLLGNLQKGEVLQLPP